MQFVQPHREHERDGRGGVRERVRPVDHDEGVEVIPLRVKLLGAARYKLNLESKGLKPGYPFIGSRDEARRFQAMGHNWIQLGHKPTLAMRIHSLGPIWHESLFISTFTSRLAKVRSSGTAA
jgi:hypothetical protein